MMIRVPGQGLGLCGQLQLHAWTTSSEQRSSSWRGAAVSVGDYQAAPLRVQPTPLSSTAGASPRWTAGASCSIRGSGPHGWRTQPSALRSTTHKLRMRIVPLSASSSSPSTSSLESPVEDKEAEGATPTSAATSASPAATPTLEINEESNEECSDGAPTAAAIGQADGAAEGAAVSKADRAAISETGEAALLEEVEEAVAVNHSAADEKHEGEGVKSSEEAVEATSADVISPPEATAADVISRPEATAADVISFPEATSANVISSVEAPADVAATSLAADAVTSADVSADVSDAADVSADVSDATVVIADVNNAAADIITLTTSVGSPAPLGPSLVSREGSAPTGSVNFAVFSQHATAVWLCIFLNGRKEGDPDREFPLDPSSNRTGSIWHVTLNGLPLSNVLYALRVDGPKAWEKGHRFDPSLLLLDPYAPLVAGRRRFGDESEKTAPLRGTFEFAEEPFDWEGDEERPRIREEDLIIYEMNVRAFTADASSGVDPLLRGSYKGMIEKIPHLVELGVNAVELLPIFEFDELEFQRFPNPRDHLVNTWGYSTVNFFAPMSRYASNGGGPVAARRELKQLIKALHAAGIEVILDVVYNHTNEGGDLLPYTTSFRGIDSSVYYIVLPDKPEPMANYSGCGNTLNSNHPVVMQLILDSLRHWVEEYHVDGFRFDLASILCRGLQGEPLKAPPIVRAIAKDSVLSNTKLIAEPWDCGGLYLVGSFPNWDRWAEWNGRYRDVIRRFIKGDCGMKAEFATRIAGSSDMYKVNNRKPFHSINFVIAHDGFTLMDLVSYNRKHNDANGEGNSDGSNDNFSWNCGVEGATNQATILGMRMRQMKNFHLVLMLSLGCPMMLMGDEYGHSRDGNNNSYGHDNQLNNFQWQQLEIRKDSIFRFFSSVNKLRLTHPSLRRKEFYNPGDIVWHEDNWTNPESRFLAFTIRDYTGTKGDLYAAFNAHTFFVDATLPRPPLGKSWLRLIDTNLPSPSDFVEEGVAGVQSRYNIAPFSSIVLIAK